MTEAKLRFEVTLTRDGSTETINTFTWGATRQEAYARVAEQFERDGAWGGWSFTVAQEPTGV
jgi:hypothetical protein